MILAAHQMPPGLTAVTRLSMKQDACSLLLRLKDVDPACPDGSVNPPGEPSAEKPQPGTEPGRQREEVVPDHVDILGRQRDQDGAAPAVIAV